MLKQITLRKFEIIKKEKPSLLSDHVLMVFWFPDRDNEKEMAFSPIPKIIKVIAGGIVDYSINDKTHDCVIYYDDAINDDMEKTSEHVGLFVPKTRKFEGESIDHQEGANPLQMLDQSVAKEDCKAIRSYPNGDSAIYISDESIRLKCGDQEFIIGKNQILQIGEESQMSFPNKKRGIIKQKDILSLIPVSAFVPPFCFQEWQPDTEMIQNAAEMCSVIKKMKGILG